MTRICCFATCCYTPLWLSAVGCLLGSLLLGMTGCTTPGQVGIKTPQGKAADYPPLLNATGMSQQAGAEHWRAWLKQANLADVPYDGDALLGTPRSLPMAVAGRVSVLAANVTEPNEVALKEGLRRLIETHRALFCACEAANAVPLSNLSLVTFSREGALYRAVYQQRGFAFPLAPGVGDLQFMLSKTGLLMQWSSTLLPQVNLPQRTQVDPTSLPERMVGREFTYTTITGATQRYRVANASEVFVREPVILPHRSGERLALHVVFPVIVGSGTSWTVYIDAINGEELEVKANFVS